MSTEIYYFSGTGNSLVVARDMAEKLEGNLISIHSMMDKDIITIDADVIGIVFPVYYVGTVYIPLIVQKFVKKLEKIKNKYIFAICTYGGAFGSTLEILDEMIRARGGRLATAFGVHMPQNAFRKPYESKTKLYSKWKEKKLEVIYRHVKAKNEGWFDSDGLLMGFIGTILVKMMKLDFFKPIFVNPMIKSAGFPKGLDLTVDEIIPFMDRSFHIDEKCAGCQTCSKICPVQNIELVDDKPVWRHQCENCLACIKWCPQGAIHGFGELPRGYHHPEVEISEMFRQD